MTGKQDEHVKRVCLDTTKAVIAKYKAGQKEHGGNLWRKPVINFMGDELLDHIVYFHVMKEQWKEMEKIAADVIKQYETNTIFSPLRGRETTEMHKALVKIHNLLTIGNPEGKKEQGD